MTPGIRSTIGDLLHGEIGEVLAGQRAAFGHAPPSPSGHQNPQLFVLRRAPSERLVLDSWVTARTCGSGIDAYRAVILLADAAAALDADAVVLTWDRRRTEGRIAPGPDAAGEALRQLVADTDRHVLVTNEYAAGSGDAGASTPPYPPGVRWLGPPAVAGRSDAPEFAIDVLRRWRRARGRIVPGATVRAMERAGYLFEYR